MTSLAYKNGHLEMDGLSLADLAGQFGTPLYVYSRNRIEHNFRALQNALQVAPEQLCYGVKANASLAVLQVLAGLGAGFDIVSGGELQRVQRIGGDLSKTVFSGVGKTEAELRLALETGIGCINVESEAELLLLAEVASHLQVQAPVSLRVNPDIEAGSHPYIVTGARHNKFGIETDRVPALYEQIAAHNYLNPLGIDCHLGSQITEVTPFLAAAESLLALIDRLATQGIKLGHLDLGGGFGVTYADELVLDWAALVDGLTSLLGGHDVRLLFEPGRSVVADAGVLLTQVLYTKQNADRHFTVVDAAMNDLLRPALYQAWHEALPELEARKAVPETCTDLVGPVCETGDFLALERPLALQKGDYVALTHAGAYGFVMSSNYNTRARVAEVMLTEGKPALIRERETFSDMVRLERKLPGI